MLWLTAWARPSRGTVVSKETAANQGQWLLAIPTSGLPSPSVQPKQRFDSNGTRSRITCQQARASLCATALRATTILVLAFLR